MKLTQCGKMAHYVGKGTVSTPGGVLSDSSYVFGLAETTASTTPGEMLAAAVAPSMSRMVALKRARLGARLSAVDTRAVIAMNDSEGGWMFSGIRLEITVQTLEPTSDHLLYEAVEEARPDCPVVSVLNLDVAWAAKSAPLEAPIAA